LPYEACRKVVFRLFGEITLDGRDEVRARFDNCGRVAWWYRNA